MRQRRGIERHDDQARVARGDRAEVREFAHVERSADCGQRRRRAGRGLFARPRPHLAPFRVRDRVDAKLLAGRLEIVDGRSQRGGAVARDELAGARLEINPRKRREHAGDAAQLHLPDVVST